MSKRNIDTQLLRTFATVAETGNMTQASRVLNLTQGAVSQHIKRLEEQLGSALFLRERSGLVLTEAGSRVRQLLTLNDELWHDMTTPRFAGRVRLGVPIDLISGRLPSILRLFAQAPIRMSRSILSARPRPTCWPVLSQVRLMLRCLRRSPTGLRAKCSFVTGWSGSAPVAGMRRTSTSCHFHSSANLAFFGRGFWKLWMRQGAAGNTSMKATSLKPPSP